jgi:hypothetical protein
MAGGQRGEHPADEVLHGCRITGAATFQCSDALGQ